MKDLIIKTLSSVENEFSKNELAYLTLTTKIEHPLRDRWAFSLHKNLEAQNTFVAREWNRVDIALVKNNKPVALIELKAMYTFDAALLPKNAKGFVENMTQDAVKARKLATDYTNIYTVLLATHPHKPINSKYRGIVKYDSGINKAFDKYQSAEIIKNKAIEEVNINFKSKNVINAGELKGGEAFGIKTSVLYWLVDESE